MAESKNSCQAQNKHTDYDDVQYKELCREIREQTKSKWTITYDDILRIAEKVRYFAETPQLIEMNGAMKMAFRIAVLQEILDFLQTIKLYKHFEIEINITKKDRKFINELIDTINSKKPLEYEDRTCDAIARKINSFAKDVCFSLNRESDSKYVLYKFYTDNFLKNLYNKKAVKSYSGDDDNYCSTIDVAQKPNVYMIDKNNIRVKIPNKNSNKSIYNALINGIANNKNNISEKELLQSDDDDVVAIEPSPQTVITISDDELEAEVEKGFNIDSDFITYITYNTIKNELNNNCETEKVVEELQTGLSTVEITDAKKPENGESGREMMKFRTDSNSVTIKCEEENKSYTDFEKDLNDLQQLILDDDGLDSLKTDDTIDKEHSVSSKRSRSDSVVSSPEFKKTRVLNFKNFKNICIVHKNYPQEKMKPEHVLKLQTVISETIDKTKELPLLKCHGAQNGGLIYCCHSENSVLFMEMCLNLAGDFKMLDDFEFVLEKHCHRMKIRLNCLFENIKSIFNRLESYNKGLNTDSWCATDVHKYSDHIVIDIEVDNASYKYICERNCSLFAGVDVARFSTVW